MPYLNNHNLETYLLYQVITHIFSTHKSLCDTDISSFVEYSFHFIQSKAWKCCIAEFHYLSAGSGLDLGCIGCTTSDFLWLYQAFIRNSSCNLRSVHVHREVTILDVTKHVALLWWLKSFASR